MPTTVTKTVKSSGGDYTSLSSWEAGQQGDLVTADELRQAECYAIDDTTDVLIDGSTADATRYMRVYVAAGEGHIGIFSTSKYRLTGGAFGTTKLDVFDSFTRIEDVQVNHTGGGSGALNINLRSPDCRILRVISKGSTGGGGIHINSTGAIIRNTLAFDAVGNGFMVNNTNSTATIQNCTAVDNNRGFFASFTGATSTLTNCLSYSNTTADFAVAGGGSTFAATYNASSDATADDWAGTGNRVSQTFTFTSEAGDDFHITSADAGAKDFGTDLSATFTTDIDGNTRSGSWDIGMDEVAVASLIKTINGLAQASVKTVNGLAIASVKTFDGLANV